MGVSKYIIEKSDIKKSFAKRLRDSMIAAGYQTAKAVPDVNVQALADITGHSKQICRKYLQGLVIPDPVKLIKLAEYINVSPGWLLFGDDSCKRDSSKITISIELLHYIFTHATKLYCSAQSRQDIPSFLLKLATNISKLDTNDEQSKKIIDLVFSLAAFEID